MTRKSETHLPPLMAQADFDKEYLRRLNARRKPWWPYALAAVILVGMTVAANADGVGQPRIEPEPMHAECRIIFGLIPCNQDRSGNPYTWQDADAMPDLTRVKDWMRHGVQTPENPCGGKCGE